MKEFERELLKDPEVLKEYKVLAIKYDRIKKRLRTKLSGNRTRDLPEGCK